MNRLVTAWRAASSPAFAVLQTRDDGPTQTRLAGCPPSLARLRDPRPGPGDARAGRNRTSVGTWDGPAAREQEAGQAAVVASEELDFLVTRRVACGEENVVSHAAKLVVPV